MLRKISLVVIVGLTGDSAAAEGVLSCRWSDASTAIAYGAVEEKAPPTDVRALMQGAALATADGQLPRFPSLTSGQPEHETPPLVCIGAEPRPVDGLIKLTFTRRVRLGVEYTLGRCRLHYRCPPAAADGAARKPERLLSPAGATAGAPTD